VPKLWTDTIETHRQEVRDAVLDTAGRLITDNGLLAVTMSRVAEEAGIGRATLYKYFPDVESILLAWHERQVAAHLEELIEVRDQDEAGDPIHRLHAVLEKYALITNESHRHRNDELATSIHRDSHVSHAEQHLRQLVEDLLCDAAKSGAVRNDVPPDELAVFCLHALAAAGGLPSKEAVRRLVTVTLSGLGPSPVPDVAGDSGR
jgi:AcrR family transcriptional regulator